MLYVLRQVHYSKFKHAEFRVEIQLLRRSISERRRDEDDGWFFILQETFIQK